MSGPRIQNEHRRPHRLDILDTGTVTRREIVQQYMFWHEMCTGPGMEMSEVTRHVSMAAIAFGKNNGTPIGRSVTFLPYEF